MSLRTTDVFMICTVNVRSTHVETRVKLPRNLAPNQFAYRVTFSIDEKEWFHRVMEVKLNKVTPPNASIQISNGVIGDTTAETVLKRMIQK